MGQEPAVPVAIMSVLDYGWFILLLFATPLLPYSPALNCPVSLVVDEDAKPVGYLANIDVKEKAKIAAVAAKKATAIAKILKFELLFARAAGTRFAMRGLFVVIPE